MKKTKSQYKGVNMIQSNGNEIYWKYQLTYKGVKYQGAYKTEKEAGLSYDLKLIDLGKEPVNILVKKNV